MRQKDGRLYAHIQEAVRRLEQVGMEDSKDAYSGLAPSEDTVPMSLSYLFLLKSLEVRGFLE